MRTTHAEAAAYTRSVRPWLLCLSLLLASASATIAHAQTTLDADAEAAARQHFEDGRLAFAEGRAEVALTEFRAAYDISQRPELLYNIGLVEDRLRHDREALDAFRGYLAAVPGAENRPSVESRIRVLEQAVAQEDALRAQAQASSSSTQPEEEPLWASPVLWVIVGVVVVGAGVGIGVGVALGQDPGTAPVMPGPSGTVVQALSVSF